jgi:hypothetical protein
MRILRRRGYRLRLSVRNRRRRLGSGGFVTIATVPVDSAEPLVRRHLAQLPQGRKAARVSELCRVREGSLRGGGGGVATQH